MLLYILRGDSVRSARQAVSSDASYATHCDLQQNPLPSLYSEDKNDTPLPYSDIGAKPWEQLAAYL